MARDAAIASKERKADRYASEPDRFTVSRLRVEMCADHGSRHIEFADGAWSCTCDFFKGKGTCSHVIALRHILLGQARVKLSAGQSKPTITE